MSGNTFMTTPRSRFVTDDRRHRECQATLKAMIAARRGMKSKKAANLSDRGQFLKPISVCTPPRKPEKL